MTDTFTAPGPGRWAIDRSHFAGGTTPICEWLMEQSMEPGMRRVFAELGVPADGLRARFVNGFMYTRLRPLVRPDNPPSRPPPDFVLRVASRVHPEFRRRAKTATTVLHDRPWVDVAQRWTSEIKPGLEAVNARFQDVDVAALDDEELGRHVADLLAHCRTNAELHFWLHGHDLGPLARYLYCCQGWGISADDALPALAGASPSTSEPLRQLARLRQMISAGGATPASLDEVRNVSPEAAAALDAYLARRGQVIVTRYDLDGLTLSELPGVVLVSILDASEPVEVDAAPVAAALRERVPAEDRPAFDTALGDARAVMDMRDDNGPLTYEWPAGLLRRALLEVGRRLVAPGPGRPRRAGLGADAGRSANGAHGVDARPRRAGAPGHRARRQGAGDPTGRARARRSRRPPIDVLPSSLAQMVSMVQVALGADGNGRRPPRRPAPRRRRGNGVLRRTGAHRVVAGAGDRHDGTGRRARRAGPRRRRSTPCSPSPAPSSPPRAARCPMPAVLARELGIPAVVGAPGALDLHRRRDGGQSIRSGARCACSPPDSDGSFPYGRCHGNDVGDGPRSHPLRRSTTRPPSSPSAGRSPGARPTPWAS